MRLLFSPVLFTVCVLAPLRVEDAHVSSTASLRTVGDMEEGGSLEVVAAAKEQWSAQSLEEAHRNKNTATFDPALTSNAPSLLVGTADSTLHSSLHYTSPEEIYNSEPVKPNAAANTPAPQQNSKAGNKHKAISSLAVIASILLFLACLRLASKRSHKAGGAPASKEDGPSQQQQGEQQQEQQHGQQQDEEEDPERQKLLQKLDELQQEMLLRQQLDELEWLLPMATDLSDRVESGEAYSALQDLRRSIQKAQQQQQVLQQQQEQEEQQQLQEPQEQWEEDSSASETPPVDPPMSIMKEAIERGVAALSRLHEEVRRHGLSIAGKTKNIQPTSVTCMREVEIIEKIDAGVSSSLASFLGTASFFQTVYSRKVEQVEQQLQELPPFKTLEEKQLLFAAEADFSFVEGARDSIETGQRSILYISSTASAVAMLHLLRGANCLYREQRDLLEGRHAMCVAEKRRQLSHVPVDPAVLAAIEKIEEELKRGHRLLQRLHDAVEEMHKRDSVIAAQPAVQRAHEAGKVLKELLDDVAARMSSLPGAAWGGETAEDDGVQRVMRRLAQRACQDAAAATRRTVDVQKRLQARKTSASSELEIEQQPEQHQIYPGRKERRIKCVGLRKQLQDALERIERKVKSAFNQAFSASVSQQ